MGRIYLDSNLQTVPQDTLQTAMQRIFQQLEDQVNEGPATVALTNDTQKLPQGMALGDPVFALVNGVFSVGIFNGFDVTFATLQDVTATSNGFMLAVDKVKLDHYKGQTFSASPPSTTEYPNDGDYGFHKDTALNNFYSVSNFAGTIKKVLMT